MFVAVCEKLAVFILRILQEDFESFFRSSTRRRILEDMNPYHYHCGKLISRKYDKVNVITGRNFKLCPFLNRS